MVLVLVVLAVAADRIALVVAQNAAADRIASKLDATGVDVAIHGFPFLTQAARRVLDDVDITAATASRDGVQVRDLVAHGTTVHVSTSSVTAGHLTGSVVVPYDEVARRAGLDPGTLGYGGPGQLELRRTVQVLGQSVEVAATGAVQVQDGRLEFRPQSGKLPDGTTIDASKLGDVLSVSVRLPQVLSNVTIVGVSPEQSGVRLRFTGSDVTFS